MRYTIPFENISTGAVADTFKTLVSLIMPTAGATCRAAIVGIRLAGGDAAPTDLTLVARFRRVLTGSGKGTAGTTITAANIPKKDNLSQDAPFTAGTNYSAEPTYEAKTLWEMAFNSRTGVMEAFGRENEIIGNYDQVIGLEVAPRTASARVLSGSIDVELR